MEEKTLFKLARAITNTSTDTVSSESSTVTYRITSLKRKLVNGKVVSTSTPSCSLGSAFVSWAEWGGVTVGDGYLDVKFYYSENTGPSRSTTLIIDQDGSGNKINLTVTQESGITYTGYLKMIGSSLPLIGDKDDVAIILVEAYLKGSDGSEKSETPNVGSAPDWCAVSVVSMDTKNQYIVSLIALSSNQTGANRSGYLFLTCGDANLNIKVTQVKAKIAINIIISVFKSITSNTSAHCDIRSDQPTVSNVNFRIEIQYGVSPGDVKEYKYTLSKGNTMSSNIFAIQDGADPRVIEYSYEPREYSDYKYNVSVI